MNSAWVTIVIAALVGSAMTLLTERFTHQPQRLATVDPGVLVTEHLKSIDPGMDEESIKSNSQAYARRLDKAVADVAQEYQVILLVKPSVITGVTDLTNEVRKRVNAKTY